MRPSGLETQAAMADLSTPNWLDTQQLADVRKVVVRANIRFDSGGRADEEFEVPSHPATENGIAGMSADRVRLARD